MSLTIFFIFLKSANLSEINILLSLKPVLCLFNQASGTADYTANTAISMLQTFDQGVTSIVNALREMAKLAAKAATDVYSESELAVMQDQFDDLVDRVNETAEETEYHNYYLLDGRNKDVTIYIANGQSITIASQDLSYSGVTDLTKKAKAVVTAIDSAQSTVSDYGSYLEGEAALLEQQIAMAESGIAQEMDYGMHVPNEVFAQELAREVMANISGNRVVALQAQSGISTGQVVLGRRNLKQPYIYQYNSAV